MTASRANILLVDDDSRFLRVMEGLLEGPDRRIFTAKSGKEALRYVLERDFVLILLDVRMPEMDGFETAAIIRQRERSRYTPIIFLSGMETQGKDVMQGLFVGALDYLFKPFTPELLKSKVSLLVDLFHLHERLKQQAVQQTEVGSIPILTLPSGFLIVIIMGFIDNERFDHLDKRIMAEIKSTEAKIVIIDVTGASVEIGIIERIKKFIEAAKKIGVRIIFTGSNTSISNALFVSNVEIDGIYNYNNLQTGIQEADRMLKS